MHDCPRLGWVTYRIPCWWTHYENLCLPADDRQLPQFPTPGGLFGGLVGGLVNQAVKGLAKEMQKTAAQTRSVSETAAMRIQQSQRIRERLGPVTVGPAMSQSMSTSNINGRVNKTISLMMPVYGSGGLPVAQAQVTQVEGSSQVESCRIAVSHTFVSACMCMQLCMCLLVKAVGEATWHGSSCCCVPGTTMGCATSLCRCMACHAT